ncbi:MAG: methionyl-tRNA formyltransferase [Gammaproteobacteria bacterium]|nr:methionyl-tRNA formyltransferase [Gammaproteobacteria bacterium]
MNTSHLKILFAGTPDFAAQHLKALLDHHYRVSAIFTQPDRPAGRGQKIKPNEVKALALNHYIPVYQPTTLKDEKIQEKIKSLAPDLIIDVAYGLFLPKEILEIPRLGCINVHPSLLPRWRGAAPIPYAILAGDQETGVSIMQVDEGWDTGDILRQESCPIYGTDTAGDLYDRLLNLGIKNLIEVIDKLASGQRLKSKKQDENKATYAKKITKQDAKIDWNTPAVAIDRKIRALNPIPGAYTEMGEIPVQIWQAVPLNIGEKAEPGTILRLNKDSIDVATAEGVLRIQKLQFPGKKALSVLDVLNSKKDFFEKHKKFL